MTDEMMHMIEPDVDEGTGNPLMIHRDYKVSKEFAAARYQRGLARPAAHVYLERLKGLGLTSIEVAAKSEPNMKTAAKELGIAVRVNRE